MIDFSERHYVGVDVRFRIPEHATMFDSQFRFQMHRPFPCRVLVSSMSGLPADQCESAYELAMADVMDKASANPHEVKRIGINQTMVFRMKEGNDSDDSYRHELATFRYYAARGMTCVLSISILFPYKDDKFAAEELLREMVARMSTQFDARALPL